MRCGAVVLSKYLRDTGPSNVARGHSKSREQWCLLVYTLDDCYDYVTLLAPAQLPTHQHINTTYERIYHALVSIINSHRYYLSQKNISHRYYLSQKNIYHQNILYAA